MSLISRRAFLAAGGVLPFAAPLNALLARSQAGLRVHGHLGYGPLAPVADSTTGLSLLELPKGFRYVTFGWTRDAMTNGAPIPPGHDGMASFDGPDGTIVLVRNHEISPAPAFGERPYDAQGGGGTTTVLFDPETERATSIVPSLTGTLRNCAGGPTPWRSWLSCEESVSAPTADNQLSKQHGYIFEVPSEGHATGEPLIAMGCFVHEAAAIDPKTGIVYETEDQAAAGLYRFVPTTRGRLSDGGKLQMLAIDARPRHDTTKGQHVGVTYGIHWVDIPEPDRPHVDPEKRDARGVRQQGLDRGGAIFSRLEGAWFGDGRLYVTATDGGEARMGQVWELDPGTERIRLIFESPGLEVLNMPDNICLSPRGGLVVCEDGTVRPSIHGLTRDGRLFRFARNNATLSGERNGLFGDFTSAEFAGATYSPDGKWLFVNMQRPGITMAITGPWEDGGL
jgi:secreted PhoX family phosphatase